MTRWLDDVVGDFPVSFSFVTYKLASITIGVFDDVFEKKKKNEVMIYEYLQQLPNELSYYIDFPGDVEYGDTIEITINFKSIEPSEIPEDLISPYYKLIQQLKSLVTDFRTNIEKLNLDNKHLLCQKVAEKGYDISYLKYGLVYINCENCPINGNNLCHLVNEFVSEIDLFFGEFEVLLNSVVK